MSSTCFLSLSCEKLSESNFCSNLSPRIVELSSPLCCACDTERNVSRPGPPHVDAIDAKTLANQLDSRLEFLVLLLHSQLELLDLLLEFCYLAGRRLLHALHVLPLQFLHLKRIFFAFNVSQRLKILISYEI